MYNFEEGEFLLLDKPYHWTSFQVVKKIRNSGKIKKIGHAGTLDPLASGLLILATGKKTKQIELVQGLEKEYTGTILLGKTTPSADLETEFDQEFSLEGITTERIQNNIIGFLGTINQIPPIFSAIKIGGKRAYDIARKGETAEIKSRKVFIKEFELTEISLPTVNFRVVCSKGTYIRSLARDFGERLGIGACLIDLRRTRIGHFHVNKAKNPEVLAEEIKGSR